jgi:hypothetical protein
VSQISVSGTSWQGSLSDLVNIIHNVKRAKAFGRLSLHNSEYVSIAHLYYRAGKLVNIVGSRGDARTILLDLKNWKRASVRFERSKVIREMTLTGDYEELLNDVLTHLYRGGHVATSPQASLQFQNQQSAPMRRIIESNLAGASEPKRLMTLGEWRFLMEATRRALLVVAHLVGPQEALHVQQEILNTCITHFPALAFLKISSNGHLQATNQSLLDRLSRDEIIAGFTALIAACQHRCDPIIGESNAHRLMIQALQELALPLATMGVFRIHNHLLTSGGA